MSRVDEIYPAHIRIDDNGERTIQTVGEHCLNVAALCSELLESAGLRYAGQLIGILHDFGKCTAAFEKYITESVDGLDVRKGSVNHTFAAVKFLLEKHSKAGDDNRNFAVDYTAEILGMAMGFHHGLFDSVTEYGENNLKKRLEADNIFYVEALRGLAGYVCFDKLDDLFCKSCKEIEVFLMRINGNIMKSSIKDNQKTESVLFCQALLIRLISSALICSDRKDTIAFMSAEKLIKNEVEWSSVAKQLDQYLMTLFPKYPIDFVRKNLSDMLCDASEKASGVYRLNIPTGGGKTLGSLRYAVCHCAKYAKKRIIIVMPLLAIIDQNAVEIRQALGNTVEVLEHHSDYVEENETEEKQTRRKLLTQFWDSPVIITTLVQMLDTFYSARTSSVCRFVSLMDCVIIFDEVQSVPIKLLSLFNFAVYFLSEFCNTTVILCSATQPFLEASKRPILDNIKDLIVLSDEVKTVFVRTKIVFAGKKTMDEFILFAQKLCEMNNSVLIVCNTKKEACNIYESLDVPNKYYISSAMCSAHRKVVISTIKEDLKNAIKVVCVSTQVMEAGVNVSFSAAVRIQAGMENVVQLAGRCNRHGELDIGYVYIVDLVDEKLGNLIDIVNQKAACESLICESKYKMEYSDLISERAIQRYFQKLYSLYDKEAQDYPVIGLISIWHLLSLTSAEQPFLLAPQMLTAGKEFRVIDNNAVPLIVSFGRGADIISELLSFKASCNILYIRKLTIDAKEYTVTCYTTVLEKLIKNGVVHFIDSIAMYVLVDPSFYSDDFGLIEGETGKAYFF